MIYCYYFVVFSTEILIERNNRERDGQDRSMVWLITTALLNNCIVAI